MQKLWNILVPRGCLVGKYYGAYYLSWRISEAVEKTRTQCCCLQLIYVIAYFSLPRVPNVQNFPLIVCAMWSHSIMPLLLCSPKRKWKIVFLNTSWQATIHSDVCTKVMIKYASIRCNQILLSRIIMSSCHVAIVDSYLLVLYRYWRLLILEWRKVPTEQGLSVQFNVPC